jgi:DNA-binding transcriptional MerR regulator
MRARSKFSFTISDLARILGKSPVTLRGWERQGLISFPRNGRGDRRFDLEGLRVVTRSSVVSERVDPDRIRLAEATVTMLELLEKS